MQRRSQVCGPCSSCGEALASYQWRSSGSSIFLSDVAEKGLFLLPASFVSLNQTRRVTLFGDYKSHFTIANYTLVSNLSASFGVNGKVRFFPPAQKWPLRPKSFYFTHTLTFYLLIVPVVTEAVLLSNAHKSLDLFPCESPLQSVWNREAVTPPPTFSHPWRSLYIYIPFFNCFYLWDIYGSFNFYYMITSYSRAFNSVPLLHLSDYCSAQL